MNGMYIQLDLFSAPPPDIAARFARHGWIVQHLDAEGGILHNATNADDDWEQYDR